MTNYIAALALVLAAVAAQAADKPGVEYRAAPGSGGSLKFSFVQAGAESHGAFGKFGTQLHYDEANPADGKLTVTVQIASLDTQDKDRDAALKGTDLLYAEKFVTAQYIADSFVRRADGVLEADGKLTLRGVTKPLRLPLTLKRTASGLELSGKVTIRRLDYGVGQGEWKSTEWVGDEVTLAYHVPMSPAQ